MRAGTRIAGTRYTAGRVEVRTYDFKDDEAVDWDRCAAMFPNASDASTIRATWKGSKDLVFG